MQENGYDRAARPDDASIIRYIMVPNQDPLELLALAAREAQTATDRT
jgi:hypothetical protein